MKLKIREVLSTLQNLTGIEYSYKDVEKMLANTKKAPSAGAIQSRYFSDGYLNEEEIKAIEEFTMTDLTESHYSGDCINIPVHGDVQASMGYGLEVYNENKTATYSVSAQLIKALGINPNESHIIFGSGNSMEPTILGGDSLLVDLSKKDIVDGKIYCVRYDGQLYTKRLQRLSKTKLKMISDNKDYEPIFIDFNEAVDFEVIGEIRWCGRVFW